MIILGINHWFHDSSACIVRDGKLVVALEEERFTREKHTHAFPKQAVRRCLAEAGIDADDVDHLASSIRPGFRWPSKALYALRRPHRAAPFIKHELLDGILKQRRFRRWLADTWPVSATRPAIHAVEHHLAHAAGSFLVSPYEHAAIISLDGSGEWSSTWLGEGRGCEVQCFGTSDFPHSLGSVYEAATEFCGFRPNYDEGKTMGLAPIGDASRYIAQARDCVRVDATGGLHVNLSYFGYAYGERQRCGPRFIETFGPARRPGGEFEPHHADVAAAFQQVLEECALKMARYLKVRTGARHLVIAGGVALNSVMNGRLLREAGYEDVYIMPAAGDNGTAIGAAYVVFHSSLEETDRHVHDDPFIGNAYDDAAIESVLAGYKLAYRRSDDIAAETAALLERGAIVGWFQGRMEIGPRALGARSILANPAIPDMKDKINAEVKFRDAYRPFSPSSTIEAAGEFFDIDVQAPFMLKICPVREDKRALMPAITHVDGSARLQTVSHETNPIYHSLITELGRRTGIPVVLNTSFNIQGEPVVESPRDALRCFYSTGLDYLCIGPFIVGKRDLPPTPAS